MKRISPKLAILAAGAALVAATAPAVAQPFYDQGDNEITVEGHYGTVPQSVQSLSLRVSYADLDLGTPYGRDVLRDRIGYTADFLCDKLGESDDNLGAVPSCQSVAFQDGMQQAHYVERGFLPGSSAFFSHAMLREPHHRAMHRVAMHGRYPACSANRHDHCVELGRW